jgi:hypothetical protein
MMFLCPVFPRLKQTPLVMRGLDPRIHPFSQDDGLPGQALRYAHISKTAALAARPIL